MRNLLSFSAHIQWTEKSPGGQKVGFFATLSRLLTPLRNSKALEWSPMPNSPIVRYSEITKSFGGCQKKGKRKKNPRNTPNPCPTPLPLRTKPIADAHKAGRPDKGKARSHLTRSFLVVSKTELSSIRALLLLGCWCGERRGSQLSKQKQGLAGGRPRVGAFSLHTSAPLNARGSGSSAGSCLLLSQRLRGPRHQGVGPEQVNTICLARMRCPSPCLPPPAGSRALGNHSQLAYPPWIRYIKSQAGSPSSATTWRLKALVNPERDFC